MSPLRAQYLRLKQSFPDALLLFRVGDFYELYDEVACVAAHELGVTLAARAHAGGERIPLCSLSYHTIEAPIKRLVAHGYKVAIAEQIGDPRTARRLVEREVVRVISSALTVDTHACPPSTLATDPAGAEPDGSSAQLATQENDTAIMVTGTKAGGTLLELVTEPCETERATIAAVQLVLFDLPAGSDDRGR